MRKFVLLFLLALSLPFAASAQLTVNAGGTGTTTFPARYVVMGNSSLRLTAVATSSLGLPFGTGVAGNCVQWTAGNNLGDAGAACGSGGGSSIWPFTPNTYGGIANQSTTTALWLKNTMIIASTTFFTNASTSAGFTNSGGTWLTGLVGPSGLAIDADEKVYVSATTTFSSPLLYTAGTNAATCQTASASQAGCLAAGDFSKFNSATTTFASPIVFTLASNSATVQAASNSQNGYLALADFALIHAATTTFSSPLVYTLGTNAVTCPTCTSGGGTGNVGTSSVPVLGGLAYWTTTTATPALLSTIATTSQTFSGPFSIGGTIGALVGGANSTITWTGLATTSQPSSSNLLVSNGAAGVYGVATTTASCAGTASCTAFTILGSSPVTITGSGAWPFTTGLTNFGTSTQATTTVEWFQMGLYASSTSQFVNATTSQLTIGNSLWLPNVTSKSLLALDQNGLVIASTTIGNSQLSNSSITINSTSVSLGGSITVSSTTLLADNSTFSGNNLFTASTTMTKVLNLANASSSLNTFSTVWIPSLGTPAGAFLAVDPNGKIISTTTPLGGTGAAWAFTPSTYDLPTVGAANQSTTTPFWLKNTLLIASSTYVSNYETVGTTTKSIFPLTVGTSTAPQLALSDNTTSDFLWTFRNTGNTLYVATSSSAATSSQAVMTIDPNGLVRFGPPDIAITPENKLSVIGNSNDYHGIFVANINGGTTASTDIVAGNDNITDPNAYVDIGVNSSGNTNASFSLFGKNDAYVFSNSGLANLVIANASTTKSIILGTGGLLTANERMRILPWGAVTMGTSTTGLGGLTIGTSTAPQLMLSDNAAADLLWTFRNSSNVLYIATSTANATSTAAAITIDGTSTAAPQLFIATTTNSLNSAAVLATNGTVFMQGLTASAGLQTGIVCLSSTNQLINESVACVASAARYKKDIQPLTVGLDEVLKLRPVSFRWKEAYNGALQENPNYNGVQYSLIADEVQKVDPHLVNLTTATTTFEGQQYPAGTVNGLTDTNHWVALFVQSFQDVVARITGLESRMDAQDARIKALEERITSLGK